MDIQQAKVHTAKGIFWRLVDQFGTHIISLLVITILARMLEPKDFGTIAIVSVFSTFFSIFITYGLVTALIQQVTVEDDAYSSVFWVNLLVSVVFYLLIFIFAPILGEYYDYPPITNLLRVQGSILIINCIQSIYSVKLQRELDFRKISLRNIFAVLFGGVAGVVCAFAGLETWALVIQSIVSGLVGLSVYIFSTACPIKFVMSVDRLKKYFKYGLGYLFTGLLYEGHNIFYVSVIGKFYSAIELGYYTKAMGYPNKISQGVTSSISSVLFPLMSKFQENSYQLKSIARRSVKMMSFIVFPCMLGLIAISNTFINVILLAKWLPMRNMMILFCIEYSIIPILSVNYQILYATGNISKKLRVDVLGELLSLICLLVFYSYGIEWLLVSQIIIRVLIYIIIVNNINMLVEYSIFQQLKDLFYNFLISIIMMLVVLKIGQIMDNNILTLIIQIFCGIFIYLGLAYITKNESFLYMMKNFVIVCRQHKI